MRKLGQLIMLAISLLFGTVGARAATWVDPASNPAKFSGVLTRWQISKTTTDVRYSITPDLDGLSLQAWVNGLVAKGVNTAVISMVPSGQLHPADAPSNSDWTNYLTHTLPVLNAAGTGEQTILTNVTNAIANNQYTVAQRNQAIIAFLQNLQTLYTQGKIPASLRFILDERLWFIAGLDSNYQQKPLALSGQGGVFATEQEFANDMSGVINQANALGLGHWLVGVRLGEHASYDWNLMGPVYVDLVTLINQQTNNWMMSKAFIGSGGGWGQNWVGVNTMACPSGSGWTHPCSAGNTAYPFFSLMAGEVGYFTFGDKLMEYKNGNYHGLTFHNLGGELSAYCSVTGKCSSNYANSPTATDWNNFLNDPNGLGFSDLVSLVRNHAAQYPNLANVIFEGDSTDSIQQEGPGANSAALTAIRALFTSASPGGGTWSGKIFVDGYDDTSTLAKLGDTGRSIFNTSYDDFFYSSTSPTVTSEPDTYCAWKYWPQKSGCAW